MFSTVMSHSIIQCLLLFWILITLTYILTEVYSFRSIYNYDKNQQFRSFLRKGSSFRWITHTTVFLSHKFCVESVSSGNLSYTRRKNFKVTCVCKAWNKHNIFIKTILSTWLCCYVKDRTRVVWYNSSTRSLVIYFASTWQIDRVSPLNWTWLGSSKVRCGQTRSLFYFLHLRLPALMNCLQKIIINVMTIKRAFWYITPRFTM